MRRGEMQLVFFLGVGPGIWFGDGDGDDDDSDLEGWDGLLQDQNMHELLIKCQVSY
jgi:hypothetical protein